VIVLDEFLGQAAQMSLTENDELVQALVPYGLHKSLGVRVAIGAPRREAATAPAAVGLNTTVTAQASSPARVAPHCLSVIANWAAAVPLSAVMAPWPSILFDQIDPRVTSHTHS
jgi:hypothetical protein